MKIKPWLIILSLGCSCQVFAQCTSLKTLEWLEGHWVNTSQSKTINESWQKISDGTFEGKGWVESHDGRRLSQESLRLVKMGSKVFYLAKVAHNPLPIAFEATNCDLQTAEFSNPQHDFPNQLIYNKSAESLKVNIRGNDGKGFDINFIKRLKPKS